MVRPKTSVNYSQVESWKTNKRTFHASGEVMDGGRRNSEPRGFADPTLSSLNKVKPVAVIKAYDDITDHKSLLDKTKILEKLRNTQIRSPLLDQRRQELEQLVNSKSLKVIRADLTLIASDAQSFVSELSARYGDASYRLDLVNAWQSLDDETRIKAVQNFAASDEERSRLLSDLRSKIIFWEDTIDSCSKVLNVTSVDPPISEIRELITKARQVIDTHTKACFLWSCKIVNVNVQVMCHHFDQLPFGTIRNLIRCLQEFEDLICRHEMSDVAIVGDEFRQMAEYQAKTASLRFSPLFLDHDESDGSSRRVTFATAYVIADEEKDSLDKEAVESILALSFENILNVIALHNQRTLLRLIFARYCSHEAKLKKKPTSRATWKLKCKGPRGTTQPLLSLYQQSDEAFWNTFWAQFPDPLVNVFMSHDIVTWPPVLQQMRTLCLSGELSSPAFLSLSKAYNQLFKTHSENMWSNDHRRMILEMEHFSPNSIMMKDQLSTKIGSSALSSVQTISLLIRNCESGKVTEESFHCLTLSVNTLLNWVTCEDMAKWPITSAVTFVWSDLHSIHQLVTCLGEDEKLTKLGMDVKSVQSECIQIVLQSVTRKSREIVKKNMPRSEYRSRECKSSDDWLPHSFEEAVREAIQSVETFPTGREAVAAFVNEFVSGCLAAFQEDPPRFSSSGARTLGRDVESLLSHIRQVTHIRETDLQSEQILHFLNVCRFITSGTTSVTSFMSRKSRVTPAGVIKLRREPPVITGIDCCYL